MYDVRDPNTIFVFGFRTQVRCWCNPPRVGGTSQGRQAAAVPQHYQRWAAPSAYSDLRRRAPAADSAHARELDELCRISRRAPLQSARAGQRLQPFTACYHVSKSVGEPGSCEAGGCPSRAPVKAAAGMDADLEQVPSWVGLVCSGKIKGKMTEMTTMH